MQNPFRSGLAFLFLATAMIPIACAQDESPAFSVAYIEVKPSMTEQAVALLTAHAESSRAQDGNLRFQLLQRIGRSNHFAILDAWESRAHQDDPAHFVATTARRILGQ